MSTTTTNMSLVLPDVTVTIGPDWATMLNDALTRLDAHTHASGYGVKITQNGMNITGALTFNGYALYGLMTAGFTGQAPDPSTSYKPQLYYKLNGSIYELYSMDSNGTITQLTSAGAVYGGSVTAKNYPTSIVTTDQTLAAGDTVVHYAVSTVAANRAVELPRAIDCADGRFFIVSDYTGSCNRTTPRTITVSRQSSTSDTIYYPPMYTTDAGSGSSFTITDSGATVMFVRISSTAWQAFVLHGVPVMATTAEPGDVMFSADWGGTAVAPTVKNISGNGAIAYVNCASLQFESSLGLTSFGQAQRTSAGSGAPLYIVSQTALTSGNGGSLILASGSKAGAGQRGGIIMRMEGGVSSEDMLCIEELTGSVGVRQVSLFGRANVGASGVDKILLIHQVGTAPATTGAGQSGGACAVWSDTSYGNLAWKSYSGFHIVWDNNNAANAYTTGSGTGAAVTIPSGTCAAYIRITVNGTPYKIPLYS